MAKAKKRFQPIHKPGYVEDELRRMATDPHLQGTDHRHRLAVIAEALLMIMDRLPPDTPEKSHV